MFEDILAYLDNKYPDSSPLSHDGSTENICFRSAFFKFSLREFFSTLPEAEKNYRAFIKSSHS